MIPNTSKVYANANNVIYMKTRMRIQFFSTSFILYLLSFWDQYIIDYEKKKISESFPKITV